MSQLFGDNVIPFTGRHSVGTTRSLLPGERPSVADDQDEPAADRVREITLALRRRGWSEDSILALKVAITMGGAFILAYALASVLNALGLAGYILS